MVNRTRWLMKGGASGLPSEAQHSKIIQKSSFICFFSSKIIFNYIEIFRFARAVKYNVLGNTGIKHDERFFIDNECGGSRGSQEKSDDRVSSITEKASDE